MPDSTGAPEAVPGTGTGPQDVTLSALQQAMAAGELTAAELTAYYLERTARLNPGLHAVITVSPDAAAEARASDEMRAAGAARGPLEGIPVLVKDNIQAAGMPTTSGSPALLGAEGGDAFLVGKLRQAGAVIIGKANLSEWANFRSLHSISGWSTLGGQTANPRAPGRNPSGSSSGSGAAVAGGLAPLSVGTETDGSIVCPSSACGVVGIKPTLGLVSRSGCIPISLAQDSAGPMALCVADAAELLAAIAGLDPADPASPGQDDSSGRPGASRYASYLDPAGLQNARLGIWRAGSAVAGPRTIAVLDEAVKRLLQAGATVLDPLELPGAEQIEDLAFTALLHEFKRDMNAYLRALPGSHPATLAELIEFNRRHAATVLEFFGQDIFEQAEATSGDPDDPAGVKAREEATGLARAALDGPLAAHGLDAIVALTLNPAHLTDPVLGDHNVFQTSTPAATAGYPSVTVPAGAVAGLPVGVSFIGTAWSEPKLIALAYAFEQAAARRQSGGQE